MRAKKNFFYENPAECFENDLKNTELILKIAKLRVRKLFLFKKKLRKRCHFRGIGVAWALLSSGSFCGCGERAPWADSPLAQKQGREQQDFFLIKKKGQLIVQEWMFTVAVRRTGYCSRPAAWWMKPQLQPKKKKQIAWFLVFKILSSGSQE